jgi:hypothetical protein
LSKTQRTFHLSSTPNAAAGAGRGGEIECRVVKEAFVE